jgi:hypothetical protein
VGKKGLPVHGVPGGRKAIPLVARTDATGIRGGTQFLEVSIDTSERGAIRATIDVETPVPA